MGLTRSTKRLISDLSRRIGDGPGSRVSVRQVLVVCEAGGVGAGAVEAAGPVRSHRHWPHSTERPVSVWLSP